MDAIYIMTLCPVKMAFEKKGKVTCHT